MKRVGYDADTQKYTFRDQNGVYWEGPEGAEYGELRKGIGNSLHWTSGLTAYIRFVVGQESRSSADLEATAPAREDGYAPVPESVGVSAFETLVGLPESNDLTGPDPSRPQQGCLAPAFTILFNHRCLPLAGLPSIPIILHTPANFVPGAQ